jgi:Flp pilus assembly protein TadG
MEVDEKFLRRDARGAVYVEFIAAFMPVLAFFLCIAQLADLYATKLVVQHAAYRTARAGAVVFPDDPAHYTGTDKLTVVRSAGYGVMLAKRTIIDATIHLPNGTDYARGAPVDVEIEATTRCIYPLANRLLCSGLVPMNTVRAAATLPAHAAEYPY